MRTTALWTAVGALGLVGMMPGTGAAADRDNDRRADSDLDYTYLQLNAINRDIDALDSDRGLVKKFHDGGGWSLNGSFSFLPKFFVFGEYSDTDSDIDYASSNTLPLPANTAIKRLDAGVGTHRDISRKTDFIARAAYVDIDYGNFDIGESGISFNGGLSGLRSDLTNDTTDGYLADAAVRSQLTRKLDALLGLRYTNVGSIDSTSWLGSLMYEFNRNWALDLGADIGSDVSTYRLGVRFQSR
ncbi:MAG TPA: hypothetical protein VFV10_11320 [Gammaproteobacteria bacterium]|nr:hypothetical protein [Gammaproteobacteria bacterium]